MELSGYDMQDTARRQTLVFYSQEQDQEHTNNVNIVDSWLA